MLFNRLAAGLRGLLHKERVEDELDEEIQHYLEAATSDKMRAGMDREQALRTARLELGSVEGVKERVRDVAWERHVESLGQDVGFAARLLRKDLGYTATAILTLAVGIGVNTALFTLFSAVALKPLPVSHPAELVSLSRTSPEHPQYGPFSFADYLYYKNHTSIFAGVAAETAAGLRLSGEPSSPADTVGAAEPVTALFVTSNYFSTFQLRPILGRDFLPEEEQRTSGPYPVLLSDNYWERRFGGDPGVLGRRLSASGIPLTVIGVTPRDFMGTRPEVPDVWINMAAWTDLRRLATDRTTLCCAITARLKPTATLQQARAELSVLTSSLRSDYPPAARRWSVQVIPATPFGPNHDNILRMFVILQIAMGLVLLIACANVAGLLLRKTAARQREIAMRLALGATRTRVLRQLVTEGVFIAVIAGTAALLVSWQTLLSAERVVFGYLAAHGDTLAIDITPNLHVFLYALAISMLAGVSFAVAPALQASRADVVSGLKQETAGFGVRRKSRLQAFLVAAQIAVSLALLIGAGLLSASSARLLAVNPGFDTRTVLNLTLSRPAGVGAAAERVRDFERELDERLGSIPGVASVSFANRVPLGGNVTSTRVVPLGDPALSATGQAQFPYSYVSKEYFHALGIPLLRGRTFTTAEIEAAAPVAIVSEALAQRFWPRGDALGQHVALGFAGEVHDAGRRVPLSGSTEIIGVVRDVYSVDLATPDPGTVYLPKPPGEWSGRLLVRVQGDPRVLSGTTVRTIRAVDATLTVSVETLHETMLSGGLAAVLRVSAMIFGAIGLIGLVLASVGVYALVAYGVSQQTREVGIRTALGARPGDVISLLLKQMSRPIIGGLLLGCALGIALSLVLSSRLFLEGARLLDPAVIVVVALVMGATALLAAYAPVRRAAALDPAKTLRFE